MTLVCGLDFGTSNSTIARLDSSGVPHLLKLEAGRETIPSVIFFGFEDDSVHFGRQAVAEYVTPAQFDAYRDYGLSIGFKMVFSGPFVRSSYMADMVSEHASQTAC